MASSLALAPAAQADPFDLFPPVASITATPNPAQTGELVTFDGSGSSDFDGTITRYEWDLDGDSFFETDTGSQSFVATQYFSPGDISVGLRVSDTGEPFPNTDEDHVTLTVQAPPSASFDVSPSSPATGETITFTSTSSDSDGSIQSEAWDLDNDGSFDDGSGSVATRSFTSAGTKTVRLRAVDNDGLTNIATQTVNVDNQGPTASFDFSPALPVTGETVNFTSTSSDSDGSIQSEDWDLDNDGSFDDASGPNASTSFASAGAKTVSLRVVDSSGSASVATRSVSVGGRPPEASFTISPSSPLTAQTITFTANATDPDGSIASYAWDLDNDGDFDDATGSGTTASYDNAGTRQIRLLVTDDDGLTAVVTRSVSVGNRGPSASFDISPAAPLSGETVTFTSTSSDPDGSIQSEHWDLDNDGEFDDASGNSAATSFATPGTKTVKLQVMDSDNTFATATRTVSVGNRLPEASFTVSPSAPLSSETITFTATATDSDGSIAGYAWDLDNDGSFDDSTSSIATKSFPTPGAKTVRLRVTDDKGGTATTTAVVNVGNRGPTADFTYSPSSFQTLQTVTFTSTASDPDGSIASHQWDFNNDGVFEKSGSNVTHQFPTPGVHAVTLLVTDSSGATDSVQQTVSTGNRSPTAAYSTAPSAPVTGQAVTFTSTSSDPDGTIVTHEWDFDDNGTYDAVGASVPRAFALPGTYKVTLRVTDSSGATNVLPKNIVIGNRAPTVTAISTSPAVPTTLQQVTFSSNAADPEGLTPLTISWDLDNDGAYDDGSGPAASRSFSTSGAYTVKVRVVDSFGATTTLSKSTSISNRPPSASFVQDPAFPSPFVTVKFMSTSGDLDGTITKHEWDTDNDGSFDDGTAATVTRKFNEAGSFTVRLRVTDNKGTTAIAAQTVFIGNRPPSASFGFSPAQPTAGQVVTLFSTASDPDSPIVGYGWDLDGNGTFNDATGGTATRVFPAGSHNVGLVVTDNEGASSFFSQTITVSAQPAALGPAGQGGGGPSARLMSPFPVVRIAGTIHRRGSRLRRLTVTAPTGATVLVRCQGRSCPFGRQSRVVKSGKKAKGRTPTARVVRIKRFERKLLRSGTVIGIFVTKPGTIGKYTRFKIRARKAPVRSDRCLASGSSKPVNCPTS